MEAQSKKKKGGGAHTVMSLNKRIEILEATVEALVKMQKEGVAGSTKRVENSIQRVEDFNGEEIPVPETNRMRLTEADKMRSMDNAIRCLPPNYIKDGRHTKENIGAICGFKVSDEMLDEVYSKVKHQSGMVVPIV